MQYPFPESSRPDPDSPATGGLSDAIAARDAIALLRLLGQLGALRAHPRQWRMELLAGILELFPADAAAAMTFKGLTAAPASQGPTVVSLVETGLRSDAQRQALLREFNTAPLGDPLSRHMLGQFTAGHLPALTRLRSDLVDPQSWQNDPHVLTYRRATGTGDCIFSLLRGERGAAHGLLVMRSALSPPPEGGASPRTDLLAAATFTPRERLLLDTLHRGLDGLYRAEEGSQKFNRASALRPRLRETLELILAGLTERQAAEKMQLSIHTVHDYVKSLYIHFGVSSRTDLLARWVQDGGELPDATGESAAV